MRTILMAKPDGELEQVKGYSLREAADLLVMHPATIRKRVRSGLWPHVLVGRQVYFTEDQLARIVDARTHEYPAHEPGVG